MPVAALPAPPDGVHASQVDVAFSESGYPSCSLREWLEALVSATNMVDALRTAAIRRLALQGVNVSELLQRPTLAPEAPAVARVDTLTLIRQLFLGGLPSAEVADLLGLRQEDVAATFDTGLLGIPRHRLIPSILALHREGKYPAEIGKELGVSREYAHRMLKVSGVQPHRMPSQKGEHETEVLRLWNEGYTAAYVSRKLELGLANVEKIIWRARKAGEPVRSGRRPNAEDPIDPPKEQG